MATTIFEDLILLGLNVFGFDASCFQDNPDTVKKPDLITAAKFGFAFAGFRGGYGVVVDYMFDFFWKAAKGLMPRLCYWYLDYYSHINDKMGIDGVEWGKRQARAAWALLKLDPGELPLYLDIESVGNKKLAANITWLNADKVMQIARAFLEEYDRLSGGKAGIYCSLDFLRYFGKWFKDRPIWVAWYNKKALTTSEVLAQIATFKWINTANTLVQFKSDGDINGDGYGDGLAMGFESRDLDLNYYLGTLQQWSVLIGQASGIPEIPVPPVGEDPVVTPPDAVAITKTVEVKKVVCTSGLNVRNKPKNFAGSNVLSCCWLETGQDVPVLEKQVIGKDVWYKVGAGDHWAAGQFNGIQYMN